MSEFAYHVKWGATARRAVAISSQSDVLQGTSLPEVLRHSRQMQQRAEEFTFSIR